MTGTHLLMLCSRRAISGPDARMAPWEESAASRALRAAQGRSNEPVFEPVVGATFNSCEEAKDSYCRCYFKLSTASSVFLACFFLVIWLICTCSFCVFPTCLPDCHRPFATSSFERISEPAVPQIKIMRAVLSQSTQFAGI